MTTDTPPSRAQSARRALSDIFAGLARSKAERLSIDDVLGGLSDRSLGACLILFAAPNMLPMPPGVSSLFAIPLIFIAAQIMVGNKSLWLPKRIRRWSLGSGMYRRLADGMSKVLRKAESFVRPRLKFLTSPIAQRALGAFALLLALVSLIPIPLGHLPPAFSLMVLGLGVMERDGLMAVAGVFFGTLSLGLIAGIGGGIFALIAGS